MGDELGEKSEYEMNTGMIVLMKVVIVLIYACCLFCRVQICDYQSLQYGLFTMQDVDM